MFFMKCVVIAVIVSWIGVAGVSSAPTPTTQPSEAGSVRFEMALYLLSAPRTDLSSQVRALQQKDFRDIQSQTEGVPPVGNSLRYAEADTSGYAPPDERSLKIFGRGLSPEDAKRLQQSAKAWIFEFAGPRVDAPHTVRRACEFMLRMANANDAVIWDESTREVFTAAAWKARRIDGWENGIPNVSQQIAIHYYVPDGRELPRAITLGMEKFGCPDAVVNDVPRENSRACGNLINVVCQLMVEQRPPTEGRSELAVDFQQLRHAGFRETVKTPTFENAKKQATLIVNPGKRDEGDPDNRLIELTFDKSSGRTPLERQSAFLKDLFGSTDHLTPAPKDDKELLAARDRARVQIARQKVDFLSGLPIGDTLLVKAPFKDPGGEDEWMWVEVTHWRGDRIDGILQNNPFHVRDLRAGSRVTVREADLFDFIRRHADGSEEGNETGKILERQERAGN